MSERFDRLTTLPGDSVKGLAASAWAVNLGDLDRDQVLRAVIEVTRKLILPEWETSHPDDRRPQEALEAAESWLATKSPDAVAQAKATAKACTAARNETFGKDHRVPEAARAIAWSAGAKDSTYIWDALIAVEQELLARIALVAEYQRAPEQRRAIVDILRKALTPAEEAAGPAASDEPVPYSARGVFAVGQRLVHAKFGNLVVTTVSDKTIDVQLDDGSVKRLAHKVQ